MAISLGRSSPARHRAHVLAALTATSTLVALVSCSTTGGGGGSGGGPPGGSGGGSGVGGSTSGGAPGTGGIAASGGAGPSSGGDSASGGAQSSGGESGTGGSATGGAPACDPSAAPVIPPLGYQSIVESDDFAVMVYAIQPPDSDDWYLVDATGYVRVFAGGVLQETPFLDLSAMVQDSDFGNSAPTGGATNYDERGLLSIAFPPDYATSGKFYVTIVPTTQSSAELDHDLILEYTRSAGNPLVADPASRVTILDLEAGGVGYAMTGFSYAKYHNASTVLFGPDGMLYVGMGDGGGDCNAARPDTPQQVDSPYGKILRLDPKQPAPYAAQGNPFAQDGDPRVYHYGVRNPFRFTFDSANGDLYIGEVGQWSHDSIAYAPAGSPGTNFGWPAFEGTAENPTGQCASDTELRAGSTRQAPIFNLTHGSDSGAGNLIVAIVGGSVYRGSAIPGLYGAYLFAEFYPNRPMRALYQCGTQTSPVTVIDKICDPNTPDVDCFVPVGDAPELRQVGAVVEGNDGELYLAANGNALLKIVPAP